MFQLTRPRGTRRNSIYIRLATVVSTHASAGDATQPLSRQLGACFNSRVRGGRDPLTMPTSTRYGVSTHASAGDATIRGFTAYQVRFNSRVRGGRDALADWALGIHAFQLTRPRGTRRVAYAAHAGYSRFNSRVRGGRDLHNGMKRRIWFQLTRPRGTRLAAPICPASNTFQLTRPRGTRLVAPIAAALSVKFQLTRPRGTRLCTNTRRKRPSSFNSRVRGGRDGGAKRCVYHSTFPLFCAKAAFRRFS